MSGRAGRRWWRSLAWSPLPFGVHHVRDMQHGMLLTAAQSDPRLHCLSAFTTFATPPKPARARIHGLVSPLPFGVHHVRDIALQTQSLYARIVSIAFRRSPRSRRPFSRCLGRPGRRARVSITFRRSPRSRLYPDVLDAGGRILCLHCLSAFTTFATPIEQMGVDDSECYVSIAFRRSPRSRRKTTRKTMNAIKVSIVTTFATN